MSLAVIGHSQFASFTLDCDHPAVAEEVTVPDVEYRHGLRCPCEDDEEGGAEWLSQPFALPLAKGIAEVRLVADPLDLFLGGQAGLLGVL